MTISSRIICDECGDELVTHTSYPAKYMLELDVIDTNINNTGSGYAVSTRPPFEGKKHFCGLECLENWIKEFNPWR